MTEIAVLLQTYGPWGLVTLLLYICNRLYWDLRQTERARLKEAQDYGEKLHVAFTEAVEVVRRIGRAPEDRRIL